MDNPIHPQEHKWTKEQTRVVSTEANTKKNLEIQKNIRLRIYTEQKSLHEIYSHKKKLLTMLLYKFENLFDKVRKKKKLPKQMLFVDNEKAQRAIEEFNDNLCGLR